MPQCLVQFSSNSKLIWEGKGVTRFSTKGRILESQKYSNSFNVKGIDSGTGSK